MGYPLCKIQVDHPVQVMVCPFGTAVLIFYLCTAVPIFGQCKHKISTASAVVGTAVVCIIGTAVLIFGQCKHIISTALAAGTDGVCLIGTASVVFLAQLC